MPETQDWAAATQTAVTVTTLSVLKPSGANEASEDLGLVYAGHQLVIVGLDVVGHNKAAPANALTGHVEVVLIDEGTGEVFLQAAVSPGAPSASIRPPFGSVRLTSGAGLLAQAYAEPGVGAQQVAVLVYYYYQVG